MLMIWLKFCVCMLGRVVCIVLSVLCMLLLNCVLKVC